MCSCGQLGKEGIEAVLVDLALGEAVAAPAQAGGAHDLTVIGAGVEDPALVVVGLDKPATDVVGAALVAPHFLDVHGVPEAIHGFLLLVGLGQPHLVCHGQMLTATAAGCRFAPTPLLMIVGDVDVVCPTDLALGAFNRAREPKRLELFPGGRFSAYTDQFERAARAAAEWFTEHLKPSA